MYKTDIVVTTIFEPAWLDGYIRNIRAHGHEQDVTIRIICDRITPPSVYEAAAQAAAQGFNIDCPTLEEQATYLNSLGLEDDFIPWNTDNRRNIGFLRAWENGADVLISIDDDNYCREDSDFVGSHWVVGQQAGADGSARYASGAGWYNICTDLNAQLQDPFFARGYPYAARAPEKQASVGAMQDRAASTKVSVNAGLWLDDPDVDAVSRLSQGPRVQSANEGAVILAPETWSPVNTQNTALLREAIPAYYYVRMGFALQGMKIDRYGDILSGYFLQKCAKHLGHAVRFGDPVADHNRSPHNLFKDLYHELAGMVLVEDMLPWLQELTLSGSNYHEAYASLADAIDQQADNFSGFIWDDGGRDFLHETSACMRRWLKLMAQLSS